MGWVGCLPDQEGSGLVPVCQALQLSAIGWHQIGTNGMIGGGSRRGFLGGTGTITEQQFSFRVSGSLDRCLTSKQRVGGSNPSRDASF